MVTQGTSKEGWGGELRRRVHGPSGAYLHTAGGGAQYAPHPGGAGQLQEAGLLEGLQLSLQLLRGGHGLQQTFLQLGLLLLPEGA